MDGIIIKNLSLFMGDGSSSITLADGSQFAHSEPATLTLMDYDPDAATIRGNIQGAYMACYDSCDPFPDGYCDYYDDSIEFREKLEFGLLMHKRAQEGHACGTLRTRSPTLLETSI